MLTAAIVAFAAGYLVGALPVAWILVRRRHGIDLRARGTARPGSASALFAGGPTTAVVVAVIECAKGTAVALGAQLYSSSGWFVAVAVAGCVVGDAFPVGFRRGGRGLLPLVTALIVALPAAGAVTAVAAVVAALLTRARGRLYEAVVAIAVPVGLVVGTRDWRSLIPAAIIVAALLSRQALRRQRRRTEVSRAPRWRSLVVDADDLSAYQRMPRP